jgi:hypothetical protein
MTAVATMDRAKNRATPAAMPTFESRPQTAVSTAVRAQSVTTPAPKPPSAWAVAPLRVVRPASNSSQRPLSSSPLTRRVLVSSPHTAPSTISVIDILNAVKPATVWRSGAGPNRAIAALFEPYAAASAFRWAWVL